MHIDSYAGLNIRNLHVHQCIMTKYTNIIKNYMEFENKDTFELLGMNCDVYDVKDVKIKIEKLTAIVTYYTRYKSIDKLPILLSFGLGNKVTVNAIIGKSKQNNGKAMCILRKISSHLNN